VKQSPPKPKQAVLVVQTKINLVAEGLRSNLIAVWNAKKVR
jgi:hypothetical protein